jgi:hypothetical protein
MSNALHINIGLRLKIAAVIKVEEPDRMKAVMSAVNACEKAGLKYVVEDIAFITPENERFTDRFAKFAGTGPTGGDGVMIVTDALMAFGKDEDFNANIRNIASPIKKEGNKTPRVIFIEQMDVSTPRMIARDIEYVRAETPTRPEVEMEVKLFIKDHPKAILDDGTTPKVEAPVTPVVEGKAEPVAEAKPKAKKA